MGKLFTAVTTSALLGVASLAYAGEARACGGDGQHVMSQDTNGDGRVDRAELVQGQRARTQGKLAALDTNKDGYIDRSEREAVHTARAAERGRHEGQGGGEGLRAQGPEVKRSKGGRGEGHWARLDTDDDGRISSAELESAGAEQVSRMLERLDSNGDGAIDATEAAAKKGRGRHGHRHGMKG